MTTLVVRLRNIRSSVAAEAGHLSDWSDHDHMCADVADKAADLLDEIEALPTEEMTNQWGKKRRTVDLEDLRAILNRGAE